MKKFIILIIVSTLLLPSCSNSRNSSSNNSKAETTTTTTTKTGNSSQEDDEQFCYATIDVKSFNNNVLVGSLDGKELEFFTTNCSFELNGNELEELSMSIISNSFNNSIKADIFYNMENYEINSCDVITPNGELFSYDEGYYFDSCYKNIAKFNKDGIDYNVDLGGLDKRYLANYEQIKNEDFGIDGFIFHNSNNVVAGEVFSYEYTDEFGRHYGTETAKTYTYFGIVQEVSDKKISVLLNNSNILVELTPSIVTDFDNITKSSKVCAGFTEQSDYLKNQETTDFNWSIISNAGDMECEITSLTKDRIHAEYNGKNIIIESQNFVENHENAFEFDKVLVDFADINYSNFGEKYEVYNVEKLTMK